MSQYTGPLSLAFVWDSLLRGDPGPALSFVDTLLDHDMAFAAGGFLRDLAERLHDAPESVEDAEQRTTFTTAIQQVLLHALDNDPAALAELLSENE